MRGRQKHREIGILKENLRNRKKEENVQRETQRPKQKKRQIEAVRESKERF